MKIAVLGGGLTGLTAAYYLSRDNHQVTVFEKDKIVGGLAQGFKVENWNWPLERTYHHLFASDSDILNFAREIGFDKIFFHSPITASLFENTKFEAQNRKQIQNSNFENSKLFRNSEFGFRIFPLDTPFDLLAFPYLNIVDKLRAGSVIAFLKLSPFLPLYEKQTAEVFLRKTMGDRVWNVLWQPLFRGKYGDYAGIILAVFIWARIKKRTKNLGYVEGGFQTLINYVENMLKSLKVNVLTNYQIKTIEKGGDKFIIDGKIYDAVVSTLPTPILTKVAEDVLPKNYLQRLSGVEYLHALTLIIETDQPILEKTYWLNVSTPKIPIMGIVQHTNFIDKKNYGKKHIAYLGWYLKRDDKLMLMKDRELLDHVLPYLRKISDSRFKVSRYYAFRAPFAQPIFDKAFVKNKPDFITPTKNFFVANLDMTYPFDRGTNYAVKLGKQVAGLI